MTQLDLFDDQPHHTSYQTEFSYRQHRAVNEFKWATLLGDVINISDMSTEHIKKSLLLLKSSDHDWSCLLGYKGLTNEYMKRKE